MLYIVLRLPGKSLLSVAKIYFLKLWTQVVEVVNIIYF